VNKRLLAGLAALALIFLFGCGGNEQAAEQTTTTAEQAAAPAPTAAAPSANGGEVLETFDGGGYTYVRVGTPGGEVWAAGPQTPMAVGRRVSLDGGMVMTNFKSTSLDRTFAEIVFVSSFGAAEAAGGMDAELKQAHGNLTQGDPSVDLSGVAKAQGGYTVAEIYGLGADKAGSRVIVRGKVVKVLTGIMGHNWLHIQDGSGDAAGGTNDLTVTSDALASVGDTVVIDGLLAVNKDFGAGYFYKAIVEDAAVSKE
jgi:hypothetical protein